MIPTLKWGGEPGQNCCCSHCCYTWSYFCRPVTTLYAKWFILGTGRFFLKGENSLTWYQKPSLHEKLCRFIFWVLCFLGRQAVQVALCWAPWDDSTSDYVSWEAWYCSASISAGDSKTGHLCSVSQLHAAKQHSVKWAWNQHPASSGKSLAIPNRKLRTSCTYECLLPLTALIIACVPSFWRCC